MNIKLFELGKEAVLKQCPSATKIYTPDVKGAQDNILIAKTPNCDMVFKFGNAELVKKNEAVSKLYNIRTIPVPQVTAHHIGDIHFEQYKKINGKTLFEAIKCGMSSEQIKQVYRDIVIEFAKMAQISPAYVNKHLINKVHDIARINISNTNNKILAHLFATVVRLANIGDKKDLALYHSDITPKNIIVSQDGRFLGFIDMDNVCICSKNYAFSMMAAKYHELGFDIRELMDEYYKASSEHLPADDIARRVKIVNASKRLLWKHSVSKQK